MEFTTRDELFEQSQKLFVDAQALLSKPDLDAEGMNSAKAMIADGQKLREKSKMLVELEELQEKAGVEMREDAPTPQKKGEFGSFGQYLVAVHNAYYAPGNPVDKRLKYREFIDGANVTGFNKTGWPLTEGKELLSSTGATGGFLVFPEHLPQLQMMPPLLRIVEERAMVIPMSARVIQIPVLDQTGTDAAPHWYGGIIPQWIEEAAEKPEQEPKFAQMELVAHELVLYTEASDTLLADSAISLEALLGQLFSGSISNEKEFTYMLGTGGGQPLGVIDAPATLVVARQAANRIQIDDIFNLLSEFQGRSPIWIAHQRAMPEILRLNGPAGNPSYVWIGNGRDAMPTTLMGFPVFFAENARTLGQRGDIGIYDFSKYLIGNRAGTTIDSSKHFKFRRNLTAWRAVCRVDGRPWLSAPITYRDGITQVSPFVVLDAAVAT